MPRLRSTVQIERNSGATKRAVLKGLIAYNVEKTGRRDYKAVTLSVRNRRDEIVGGLLAEVYWDWMYVRLLWVDARHRGGAGARLMAKAEEEARRQGARGIFLDTCSFQAPGFYKKLGFSEYGRLDEHPIGHTRFWFAKTL